MTTAQRTTTCPRSALERTALWRIPPRHCEPIPRPELDGRFEALDSAAAAHITLMCAPAGSGKTVLLHDWTARTLRTTVPDAMVAWLTVTEIIDRDSTHWHSIAEALSEVLGIAPPPAGTVKPVQYVAHLTDALRTRTTPTVLVIDDAHLMTNSYLLVAVEYLIRYLPPSVTVVLSGRHEPALRWHTLNVERRLSRIGAEDLMLSRNQVAQLFRQHECEVSDTELDGVMALTGGWAALVSIAAHRSAALGGDHVAALTELARPTQPVADFLIAEVLAGLPWQTFEFLMRTSVPERFTEDLADVLHGSRTREILDELTHSGIPHTRHSDSGELWFTYHPLLRAYLLAELNRRDEAEVARLRLYTARWFSAARMADASLTYLLPLPDRTYLEGFLREQGLGLVLDGHGARLFAELDEAATPLAEDPFLWRLRIIHALTRGEDGEARAYLDFAVGQPDSHSALVRAEWLRLLDLAIAADLAGLAGTGISAIEPPETLSRTGNPDIDCYVSVQAGTASLLQGRFDLAISRLSAGFTLSEHFARPRLTLRAMTRLAVAVGYAGGLTEMLTRAERALEFARRHDLLDSPDAQRARILIALTHHIQAEPWQISSVVGDPGSTGTLPEPPGVPVDGLPTEVDWRLLLSIAATDKHAAARSLHAGVMDLLRRTPMPAIATGLLLTATVGLLGRLHEFRMAEDLLRQAESTCAGLPGLVVAQALLTEATQKPRSTRALLEPLLLHPNGLHPINAVTGWLLYADALHRLGMPAKAVAALEAALRISEPERLVRPWLNLPAAMELLDLYAGRFGHSDEFAETLRHHPGALRRAAAPSITESEMIVLKHLPSGRTGGQIAADLGVSINTVKTHLRGLYAKLGANTRAQAVARARAVGLL